jgi:TolA-binding protein
MKTRLLMIVLVQVILDLFRLSAWAANPSPAPVKKPEPASITLESASALADKKKYDEALDVCDALIAKKGMNSLDALKLKIRICEGAKWWPEALTHYERLLKTTASTAGRNEIRLSMARIRALELADPAGLADLRKMSEERLDKPLLGRACYWLAGALMKQGKTEEAKAVFVRLIADFADLPEIDSAKGYLAACEAALQAQAERARTHREELAARQIAAAELKATAKPPARTAAMLKEADALRALGQYKEAGKIYDTIRFQGFSPELMPASYGLAECRYALGDEDKAMEAWETVLKLPVSPSNTTLRASSLLNLGNAWLDDRGDAAKAAQRFAELAKQYPDSPQALEGAVSWALALLYLGRTAEAERLLLAAKEKRGKPPAGPRDTLERLLRVCRGEWGHALPALEERVAEAETGRWLQLAELRFAAYEYKRARQAYDKVVKLAPATPVGGYALMQTGRCWNQMGERDKALAAYRQFMEKPYSDSPYADDALVRAGVIAVSYKNDARAGAEFFRYVVENLPGGDMTPLAQLRLGTVLMWQCDWKGALQADQTFIQLYPQSPCAPYIKNVRLPEIEKAIAKR